MWCDPIDREGDIADVGKVYFMRVFVVGSLG